MWHRKVQAGLEAMGHQNQPPTQKNAPNSPIHTSIEKFQTETWPIVFNWKMDILHPLVKTALSSPTEQPLGYEPVK